jgi:hypothetical protein
MFVAADAPDVTVTVTCSGFTSPFTVEVTATATTDLEGCAASASATAEVPVTQQPTVNIQGPSDISVCGSEPSTELTYTIGTTNTESVTVDAVSDGAECQAGECCI